MTIQQQDYLEKARILKSHRWLSHARQQCRGLMFLGLDTEGEAASLDAEIERDLKSGGLNLSEEHTPIIVIPDTCSVLSTIQLQQNHDPVLKREAFKQAVNHVYIETSSQCNRRCSYCPNSQNDRLSKNHFMDDAIYDRILHDLALINYDKDFHFVGYNEPLMHIDNLLWRIKQARAALPLATLIVYSNGDYLTTSKLDALIAAGITGMVIAPHLAAGAAYSDDAVIKRINTIAADLNLLMTPRAYVEKAYINIRLEHPRTKIAINHGDYTKFGTNRACTLANIGQDLGIRDWACLRPFIQFGVGYLGGVAPCCHMVTDDPRNAARLVGNVSESGIFDIYSGIDYIGWRKAMFGVTPKLPPCNKCFEFPEDPCLRDGAIYENWKTHSGPFLYSPRITHSVVSFDKNYYF
jgi:hypothetical protein